jgi:hypothetical protein
MKRLRASPPGADRGRGGKGGGFMVRRVPDPGGAGFVAQVRGESGKSLLKPVQGGA